MAKKIKTYIFYILLILIVGGYALLFTLHSIWDHPLELSALLFTLAVIGFFLSHIIEKKQIAFVIGVSIFLQMLFLFLPDVHNDIYRYLWDSWLLQNNISPFEYTPFEVAQKFPELANVWYWKYLDFKELYSIYPGSSQIIWLLSQKIINNSIIALRIVYLCLMLGITYFLHYFYQKENISLKQLTFVLLSPIFLFEGMIGMHSEVIVVFFLLAYLYCEDKGFKSVSIILFTASIWTKLYPVLILPYILIKHKKQKWVKTGLTVLGVSILVTIPIMQKILHIEHFLESLKRFFNLWIISPGIYELIYYFSSGITTKSVVLTKVITLSIVMLTMIYLLIRNKKYSIEKSALIVFTVYIITSSTVFAWYLMPLLILNAFNHHKTNNIILLLCICFPLQYLLIQTNNEFNQTFIYKESGRIIWHQLVLWGPACMLSIYYFIQKFIYVKKNENINHSSTV